MSTAPRPDPDQLTPRDVRAIPSQAGVTTPGPPARPGRITGVDAARGIALLGMMATHVFPEFDDEGGLAVSHVIASGRASAAFAVLAGVALTLSTGRLPVAQARASTGARAVGIGAIGLGLGYTDSGIAVILCYYALLFLLALPLLRASTTTLVIVAAASFTVVPVAWHLLGTHVPEPVLDDPTFGRLVTHPLTTLLTLGFTGFYPAAGWLGYLCVGLVVGRLNLRSALVAARLLAGGLAVAAAAWLLSWTLLHEAGGMAALEAENPAEIAGVGLLALPDFLDGGLYGHTPTGTWWWLAIRTPHSTTPFDLVHTTGTAVALLGLVLLVSRALPRDWLLPLVAVGSMTLTFYTAHVVVMSTEILPDDPTWAYLLQVGAALVLATAWRFTGWRGPAEAAVSALARGFRDTWRSA